MEHRAWRRGEKVTGENGENEIVRNEKMRKGENGKGRIDEWVKMRKGKWRINVFRTNLIFCLKP